MHTTDSPARWELVRSRIVARPDTEVLFLRCFAGSSWAFWLDSSTDDESARQLSILGDARGPHAERLRYRHKGTQWTISCSTGETVVIQSFFEYLRQQLAEREIPAVAGDGFELGYVGALGYELGAECGAVDAHDSDQPDAALVFADRAVVVDHRDGAVELLALCDGSETDRGEAERWCAEMAGHVRAVEAAAAPVVAEPAQEPGLSGEELVFRLVRSRAQYLDDVRACQRQIARGEAYEICLTNTAEAGELADPLAAYRALRRTSPVPFGAYLRFGELAVLSASPERFLRVGGDGAVEAHPIKGTRRRGVDAAEDAAIRAELAASEKDRAENLMIVDLLRNDLNRVCTPDSVQARKVCAIHSFSHVHQMVSTVRGRLRPGIGAVDCVAAAFPGGSMTGAPKLRAMEIIAELETQARGLYSGALGWFGLGGAADLAITIRTLVADTAAGRTTFGVGGAVVADSDPAEEFAETQVKAQALLDALGARLETGR